MRSSPSSVVGQFCHISPLTAVLVLVLFVVQLGHDGGLQALGKIIGQLVQIGAFIALAADDERRVPCSSTLST